jgi:hypothetical protein
VHLQRTDGEAALDITMQEANDIVKQLLQELSRRNLELGMKRTDKFWICYDKATVHNQVQQILGTQAKVWPQPAKSPECNKPIEHVHGWIDADMHKWLRRVRRQEAGHRITPEECKAQCTELFKKIPASTIAADVDTLPDTWQAIIDAGGGHIAADLS